MSDVESYEEQFGYRFSQQDEEFQKYLQRPADPPPIVEAWRSRENRYQDNRPRGGWGGGHSGGRGGGWGQRSHDRRYGGQPNSYNQRSHYDRY